MNFGYSINKICHQYFKKIAQSGQTDDDLGPILVSTKIVPQIYKKLFLALWLAQTYVLRTNQNA